MTPGRNSGEGNERWESPKKIRRVDKHALVLFGPWFLQNSSFKTYRTLLAEQQCCTVSENGVNTVKHLPQYRW